MAERTRPRRRCAVFRLELGGATGWGHLARGAALAAELRRRDWKCVLWTDGDPSRAPTDLRDPFDAVWAAGPEWATRPPAAVQHADWVIVDNYDATDEKLRQLRSARGPAAPRLLVMDDEGRRRLDTASLVVNPRLGLTSSPYDPCVKALLGERFALLRPGLARATQPAGHFSPEVQPVLVMLGGTDPRGLTAEVLRVLAVVNAPRFAPVVVRTRSSSGGDGILEALGRFAESIWIDSIDASALAGWAAVCRLAVSAAGGTLYELAALGLPFVALVVADNQRAFAREVSRQWHMPAVEADGQLAKSLAAAVRELVARGPGAAADARVAFGAIDGRGAARVADAMACD